MPSWSSWSARRPVTAEAAGSSPAGGAKVNQPKLTWWKRLPEEQEGEARNLGAGPFKGALAERSIAPTLKAVRPGEPRHERSNRSRSATCLRS